MTTVVRPASPRLTGRSASDGGPRMTRAPASATRVALIAPDYSRLACTGERKARKERKDDMYWLALRPWRPLRSCPRLRSDVFSDGRARTHQIAVAKRVVDASDARPVLAGSDERQWERRLLACVRMGPLAGDGAGRVRRVLENVVLRIGLPVDDRLDFPADGDHRFAEAVQLVLRLALGGLDHDGPRDRKRDRGGMETVVHQPLGDVQLVYPARLLQGPEVKDHLVRDAAVLARIEHGEVRLQACLHIVRVENCVARRIGHPVSAEHLHVGV